MAQPLRIQGMKAALESPYGTDATPADTAGIRGVGNLWGALSGEYRFLNPRTDVWSNSLSKVAPGRPYGRVVTIDWTVQLMGAGVAYSSSTPVRPECDVLLMSCGMSRTHVDTGSSESVSYAKADTSHLSCTIYAYAAGKLFRIVGCRGTWTWVATSGGLGAIRFVLQGMLITDPTETAVPSLTYSSVVPPAAVGMSLALGPSGQSSWSPAVPGFEVAIGAQGDWLDDVNGDDGIEGYEIGMFESRFTFTPRTVALSAYDPYGAVKNARLHTIDATLGVGTQYNRVDVDVDAAYLLNVPGPAEDGRFAAWNAEYELLDLILRFD